MREELRHLGRIWGHGAQWAFDLLIFGYLMVLLLSPLYGFFHLLDHLHEQGCLAGWLRGLMGVVGWILVMPLAVYACMRMSLMSRRRIRHAQRWVEQACSKQA